MTFFGSLGYQPDRGVQCPQRRPSALFWTPGRTRQLDVFVDRYEMCHRLELRDRLDVHPETLSLADLLLTKLQVVETNRKDVVDIATLLSDHPLTQDESGINMGYIASLAASDWPWWRTISMVAERVSLFARDQGLAAADVQTQVSDLLVMLAQAPKSARWRMRPRWRPQTMVRDPRREPLRTGSDEVSFTTNAPCRRRSSPPVPRR